MEKSRLKIKMGSQTSSETAVNFKEPYYEPAPFKEQPSNAQAGIRFKGRVGTQKYGIPNSTVNGASGIRSSVPENKAISATFSRSPRLTAKINSEIISIEPPPRTGEEPKNDWKSVLIAPLITIVVTAALAFVLGAYMMIVSVIMTAVSAVMAVHNVKKQKKEYAETSEKIDVKYREYLGSVSQQLREEHARQLRYLTSVNPAPRECLSIAVERERRLWERRPGDGDFMTVRLGTGTVPAAVSAEYHKPKVVIEENILETEAEKLADESKSIGSAPILCSLIDEKQTGIAGKRSDELALTVNLITELAASHSYDELKIVVLVPDKDKDALSWVRWLPHCSDDARTKRYFFTSMEDAEESLNEIEEILSRRNPENDGYRTPDRYDMLPHYLFVICAQAWIDKHPIRKFIFSETDIGCSTLFVFDSISSLPKECSQIIEIGGGRSKFYNKKDSADKAQFTPDQFAVFEADRFARCLAPLYAATEQANVAIPRQISFLEGYGVTKPEELNIRKRWEKAKTYKTLSVPIAACAGGAPFYFDIHEKYHGVMGVVAGMTRSGKTEMVQTWLLSLAANYSPQDISFILIDFKGMGLIGPFMQLPHLAGSISNLDKNIDRNLTALKSEVHRREAIFAKYSDRSIKNINDLNMSYSLGEVPERLPILLVVIDEFAEFKKNFPDFGAEIDSLVRTGGALGIFVVMMTQKPAGVVSAQTEDNIKFRWCLRVANPSASREMLGRPDAAKINNPGRAFIKIGEDDIYEEVQSFWSGAPYSPDRDRNTAEFIPISKVEPNGRRIALERKETHGATTRNNVAEIDVVVRHIADFCRENRIASADRVWPDRLPERFALTDILTGCFDGRTWPEAEKTAPMIGITDDPANQRQYPTELDLARLGHTVIYGAPVTGKTTLLKTLVMSLALSRRPDEVSIYIMDFGGWNMSIMRDIPHIGGIAYDNEPERISKLLLLISDILQERKRTFAEAGVGNITAYREYSNVSLPDVYLIVDNFGAMIKLYPDLDAFFITISNSGANYGIYLVATASSTNAVPMKISQNIKSAIALQMIDKSDFTYTVGKVSGMLPEVMGRGYVKGNPPLEFQTALPIYGEDDSVISKNIRQIAGIMRETWNGELPAAIPELPDIIPYGSVRSGKIALGLSLDKVQPVAFDHVKQHYLLISGTEQSGKSNMLQVISKQLKEKLNGKLYVFNIKGGGFSKLRNIADVFLSDAAAVDSFIESFRPELQRRHEEKQNNEEARFEPIIISIDDFTAFFKAVSNETVQRLLAIAKIGRGMDVYLIAAGDAMELSTFFNKGEALTLTLGKAKQAVMLGGCMNDHGAINLTKMSYSQKSVPVREHEGFFVQDTAPVAFRAICMQ